jgi:hypothetical protein
LLVSICRDDRLDEGDCSGDDSLSLVSDRDELRCGDDDNDDDDNDDDDNDDDDDVFDRS